MKRYIIIIVIVIILFFSSTIASSLIYFFNKSDKTETKEIQETTEAQTIPPLQTQILVQDKVQTQTPTIPSPTPINKQISGCEADTADLVCDNKKTIKTASIIYGRWDNSICPHSTINKNVEPKKKTYSLNSAINKTNFTITQKNTHPDINEDIYPNIYKHWTIDYSCS